MRPNLAGASAVTQKGKTMRVQHFPYKAVGVQLPVPKTRMRRDSRESNPAITLSESIRRMNHLDRNPLSFEGSLCYVRPQSIPSC